MKKPQIPDNEAERLRALEELAILDTEEEDAYDDLTAIAAEICQTPISLVSLVDRDRQWFKSHHGLDARESPREYAFCAHAILDDSLMVVEDAFEDRRFSDNPLVRDDPNVRFYAGAPLKTRGGANLGTLCVIDHEPRKLSDGQRKALYALARHVVSLLEMRIQIREMQRLEQAKDEFISMISHELRTPLSAIIGSLSLLKAPQFGKLEERQQEVLEMADRNAAVLQSMVEKILDISRVAVGTLKVDLQPTDLAELVRHCVRDGAEGGKARGITLSAEVPEHPVLCEIDRGRIEDVLKDLIDNALKFTKDEDEVNVSLRDDEGRAVVLVADHGPGIPPEYQSQLFDKLQQIPSENGYKPPGSGLSLHLAKKVIESQGGEIGFSSTPNKETVFHFSFPTLPGQ